MNDLKIEYLPIDSLTPYERNAKEHPKEQIEQIKRSIKDNGMNDPIGIWGKSNTIVEGHGRLIACKELGIDTVPCIRLDHMTDEQRRQYTLIHNQTTMNSGWDVDIVELELADMPSFDASFYGFDVDEVEKAADEVEKYTHNTDVPHYDVKGMNVSLTDLCDMTKARNLIDEINESRLGEDEKNFLKIAACRLYVFDYKKIAEYYASADEEMQSMMEKLALVIIDYGNAIANGYVKMSKRLEALRIEENA